MFSEGKKVLGPNLKQNSTECHTQLLTIIIFIIIIIVMWVIIILKVDNYDNGKKKKKKKTWSCGKFQVPCNNVEGIATTLHHNVTIL